MQSIERLNIALKYAKVVGFCQGFLAASKLYGKRPNAKQLLESLHEAGYPEIANAAHQVLLRQGMTARQLGEQIIEIYGNPIGEKKWS